MEQGDCRCYLASMHSQRTARAIFQLPRTSFVRRIQICDMIALTIILSVHRFSSLLKRLPGVALRLMDCRASVGVGATDSGSQDYQEGYRS